MNTTTDQPASAITLVTEGRRIYFMGNTFPIKNDIKAEGGHWDALKRAWWMSSAKMSAAERIVANAARSAPTRQIDNGHDAPGDGAIVAGTVSYKGRTYYLAGREERSIYSRFQKFVRPVENRDCDKFLLYARNGEFQFWANQNACTVIKEYDRAQTIGGLKAFMEARRAERASVE